MIIYNLRRPIARVQYIRVDRGTQWGNPFVILNQSDKERERVCELFEEYAIWRLTVDPEWLHPLRGSNLACWCTPKRCHAEALLRLATQLEEIL